MQKQYNVSPFFALLLTLCLALLPSLPGMAESEPAEPIVLRIGGQEFDIVTDVTPLANGNFLVVGMTQLAKNRFADHPVATAVARKLDESGREIWRYEYGESDEFACFYPASVLADGRILLIMGSAAFTGPPAMVLLGPDGDLERINYLPYWACSFVATKEGVAALTGQAPGAPRAIWFDPEAKAVWGVTYALGAEVPLEEGYWDAGGGWGDDLLLTGKYDSYNDIFGYGYAERGLIVCLSKDGKIKWAKTTGGNDTLRTILPLADGRALLAGSRLPRERDADGLPLALMINAGGEILWEREYPLEMARSIVSVQQTENGYVALLTGYQEAGEDNIMLLLLNETGEITSQRHLPLPDGLGMYPGGLVVDAQGRLWVYGNVLEGLGEPWDILLMQIK